MGIARDIMQEALNSEDFHSSEMYGSIKDIIPNIIEGLKTYLNDGSKNQLLNNVTDLCDVLNSEGFTYYPQNVIVDKESINDLFNNYIEFYEDYLDTFNYDQLEILNTNSKDLQNILELEK